MRDFDELYAIAADRKGGADALEALLSKPLSPNVLAATSDDQWLSAIAKYLFQTNFNWKIIKAKWHGTEEAFDNFDPLRVASYHDDDIDRLLADKRIVRNGAKVMAVVDNARFIRSLASDHRNAKAFFTNWPNDTFINLLTILSKQNTRLGGVTGQRILRILKHNSFILSTDVTSRLVAENIVDKQPSSKRDLTVTQQAFNH